MRLRRRLPRSHLLRHLLLHRARALRLGEVLPHHLRVVDGEHQVALRLRLDLLRVREFCMAEIEHFVNPNDKTTPRFASVADKVLSLFSQDAQLGTGRPFPMAIGDAVARGLVNNETLGFFLARTQLFMEKIGLDPARLRFRQHLKTEMAHYAADCWDLEIHTSYGW